MRKSVLLTICIVLASISSVFAQDVVPPRRVENPELCDMRGNPITMPHWGEKNLLIFFVDPDSYLGGNSNKKFAAEMQDNRRAEGPNIYGFGVVNTADTALPKKLIRAIVRNRVEKEAGAVAIDDRFRILSENWGLGDCNNKFIIMIVNKEGELVYCHKEEFTPEDKEHFYEFVQAYK